MKHRCFWSYCNCTQFTSIYKRSQKWQRGRQRTPSLYALCNLLATDPTTHSYVRHDSTGLTETQTKPNQGQKRLHSNPKNAFNNLFSFLEIKIFIYKKKRTLSNFSFIRCSTSNPHTILPVRPISLQVRFP